MNNHKLNILKTAIRFPPAMGGAENYIENIADKLYNQNHNIKIITTDLKQHIDYIKFQESELNTYNKPYPVTRCKTYHIPKTTYPISFDMIYKILSDKSDIFHAYCIHYYPALLTKIFSKLKKKNYFITPIYDNNNINSYFQYFGQYLLNAKGIIFISDYEKNMLENNNFKIKNSIVIPPSLDDNFNIINFNNVNTQKFEQPNNYKYKFLFAGRLSHGKGIDILLKSVNILKSKLKDFAVIISGQDFGFKNDLLKIINNEDLNNVYIYEDLNIDELKYLYKISDLFVLPSRYEAFGIVMIEAMAFSTPVIAMNNSAIPYLIKPYETGLLFNNEDYFDLSEKIIQLIDSKDLQSKVIDNCYEMIQSDFTWKNTIKKLINFYSTNI
jgi:glycosyltransferase involved in cell wall biosynthesis